MKYIYIVKVYYNDKSDTWITVSYHSSFETALAWAKENYPGDYDSSGNGFHKRRETRIHKVMLRD